MRQSTKTTTGSRNQNMASFGKMTTGENVLNSILFFFYYERVLEAKSPNIKIEPRGPVDVIPRLTGRRMSFL